MTTSVKIDPIKVFIEATINNQAVRENLSAALSARFPDATIELHESLTDETQIEFSVVYGPDARVDFDSIRTRINQLVTLIIRREKLRQDLAAIDATLASLDETHA